MVANCAALRRERAASVFGTPSRFAPTPQRLQDAGETPRWASRRQWRSHFAQSDREIIRLTMGNHLILIVPVLIGPPPTPRTFEKQVLLPGLWLEHINGKYGRVAHKRPPDPTITAMSDVIVCDLPVYVRGLLARLKEKGIEIPPAPAKEPHDEEGGWHIEHPLEMYVEDEDIRKMVMMACILAGADVFVIDRPVLAEMTERDGVLAPEFDRWDNYRHVWQGPHRFEKKVIDDSEHRQFPELDLTQVRHYCGLLEPYFRAKKWLSGRVAVALGAFLSYALGSNDGQGYLAMMTVFEALLSTGSEEITHQICERLAFMLERSEAQRLEVYRRMKKLYSTRSRLIHGDIENKKGVVITYRDLRLDAKMTIVPDQDLADLFDYCLKLFKAILERPDLLALLEHKDREALRDYYLRLIFRGQGRSASTPSE
jgi:hypothetical protein